MSKADRDTIRLLDTKLDEKTAKTLMTCALIMLVSVLIHDGDHIRQAYLWSSDTTGTWVSSAFIAKNGGDIGLFDILAPTLLVLNLTVYILPVVSIFLIRTRRFSAMMVTAVAGVFTSASFLILHLFGSATGLWGYWNISYIQLFKPTALQDVGYRINWLSWVLLFEVPALCLPGSCIALKAHRAAKKAAKAA